MGRKRVFTEDQITEAVKLRKEGKSLREVTIILTGGAGGGTRESLRRSLRAYGFVDNPPLRLVYKPRTFDGISEFWWAEFRGIFYGEGSIILTKPKVSGRGVLQPQMTISMRDDDSAVLRDIHEKLGGSLVPYTKRVLENPLTYGTRINNPQFRWAIVGIPNIYGVLPHLESGLLPSKKLREFQIVRKFCEARLEMPVVPSIEQKEILNTFYHSLRDLKRYHPSC